MVCETLIDLRGTLLYKFHSKTEHCAETLTVPMLREGNVDMVTGTSQTGCGKHDKGRDGQQPRSH